MEQEPDYDLADMHIHILPEIDDGAESMDMALAMLRIAAQQHIGTMIATPHYKGGHHNASPETIGRRIGEVSRAAKDAGIKAPDICPGNEILYDSSVARELRDGKIRTMAGSDFVLIEFRPWEEFSYIREGLRSLFYEGYQPILAHCERYNCLVKDCALAEELHRNGVLLQVNASSVLPKLFEPIPKFTGRLLESRMVDFIGTDAHRDRERAPLMLKTWRYLVKKYDPDYVREIMRENTHRIIEEGHG